MFPTSVSSCSSFVLSLSKLVPAVDGSNTYPPFVKKSVSFAIESNWISFVVSLSRETPPFTPEPATSAYFA